jgi:hypothetical protein
MQMLVAVDERWSDYQTDVLVIASVPATTSDSAGSTGSGTNTRLRHLRPDRAEIPKRVRRCISPTTSLVFPSRGSRVATAFSYATESNVGAEHGVLHNRHRSRDELVELVVRRFIVGDAARGGARSGRRAG